MSVQVGNVKVLFGAAGVFVVALGYTFMQMTPKHGASQVAKPATKSGSTMPAETAKVAEKPADPFAIAGIPATASGSTMGATDLGFGGSASTSTTPASASAAPTATAVPAANVTSATPAQEVKANETKAQPSQNATPRPKNRPSFSNMSGPTVEPVSVEPMGTASPLPSAHEVAANGGSIPTGKFSGPDAIKSLQTPSVSVTLRAIVKIDGDSVAYILSEGKLRGYRVGQSIGGNVKVKQITDDEVTLTQGAKTITLSVGMSEAI